MNRDRLKGFALGAIVTSMALGISVLILIS